MPTHYRGNETEVRALNAHINLARACDSLMARLSANLEKLGLTVAQFGVLEAVHYLGPMCQRDLGHKLLRSGGNVTVVVDNLEKHGWVRRERLADDRRMVRIHLTEQGRELIECVFPKHVGAVVREMSTLAPEEQEELRQLCRKLGKGCSKEQRKSKKERGTHNAADSTE